jgi:hypothetical protein
MKSLRIQSNDDLNGWFHELLQHYRQFSTLMAVPNADHHQSKFGPLWNVSTTRTFDSCTWLLPPNAIFNISKVSVTDFPTFTQNFTQIRWSWKTLISLSRENRQTRQTCDHIKTHSTMTKQDRAMRFSRCSSSKSLLECSTCRAPLGRRNGGLFPKFGHFPDSPPILPFQNT